MSNRSLSALNKKYLKSGGFTAPDTAAYQGPHGDYAYEAAQGAQANFLAAQRQLEEEERKRRQLAIQQGQSYQINRDSAVMMAQANSAPTNYISDAEKALYGYAPEDQAAIKSYNDVMQQISDATERPSRVMMNGKSAQSKTIYDLEKQASKMRKSWDKTGRVPEGLDTVSSRIRDNIRTELNDAINPNSRQAISRAQERENQRAQAALVNHYKDLAVDGNIAGDSFGGQITTDADYAPKKIDKVTERTQNQELVYAEYKLGKLNNKAIDLLRKDYENGNLMDATGRAAAFTPNGGKMIAEQGAQRNKAYNDFKKLTGLSDEEADQYRQYYREVANLNRTAGMQRDAYNNTHTGNKAMDALASTGYSLGDIVSSPSQGVQALVEHANKRLGGYADNMAPVNTNSNGYLMQNFNQIGKGAVTERIGETPAGEVGQWAYNFGMNAAENLVRSKVAGGAVGMFAPTGELSEAAQAVWAGRMSNASLASMGANAYTQAYQDALSRGITDSNAVKTAMFDASMEIVTEKLPLDEFFKMSGGSKATYKDMIINTLKEMGLEGTQEAISEVADGIFDYKVNGDKSEMGQAIIAYQNQGMTFEQAKLQAAKDLGLRTVESGLEGALLGGVMGVSSALDNYSNTRAERAVAKKLFGGADGAENIHTAAASIDADEYSNASAKDLAKTAQEIYYREQDKLENGKKGDTIQQGRAIRMMEEAEYLENRAGTDQNVSKNITTTSQEPHNSTNVIAQENAQLSAENTAAMSADDYNKPLDKQTNVTGAKFRNMKTNEAANAIEFVDVNGGVVLRGTNGNVSVNDVNFGNKDMNALFKGSAQSGSADIANAIMRNYPKGMNVDRYVMMAKHSFDAGRQANNAEEAYSNLVKQHPEYEAFIDKEAVKNFFDYGVETKRNDRLAAARREASTLLKSKATGEYHDLRSFGNRSENTDGLRLFTMLGINVEVRDQYDPAFVSQDKEGNKKYVDGRFITETGTMQLRAGTGRLWNTAVHEMGEMLDAFNGDEYNDFGNALITFARGKMGEQAFQQFQNKYLDAYSVESGKTKADLDKEMFNDLLPIVLGDEYQAIEFMQQVDDKSTPQVAKTIKRKIIDYVDGILNAVKSLISDESTDNSFQREMSKYSDDLQQFRDKLADVAAGAKKNYAKAEVSAEAANNASKTARHDINIEDVDTFSNDDTTLKMSKDARFATDQDGKVYIYVEGADFNNYDTVAASVKQALDSLAGQSIDVKSDGTTISFPKNIKKEYINSETSRKIGKMKKESKYAAAFDLKNILRNADPGKFDDNYDDSHVNKRENNADRGWLKYPVRLLARTNVRGYEKKIVDHEYRIIRADAAVRLDRDGNNYFYDLVALKMTGPVQAATKATPDVGSQSFRESNIAQSGTKRNGNTARNSVRNSINIDSDGNTISEKQQEYFAGSEVRDDNGKLKVVYHGSPAQFTEFDRKFTGTHGSAEGRGFYFTDKKVMADGYSKKGGQVLEGYLNIEHPLSLDEVTLKKSEVKQLIKKLDPTGDGILSDYDPSGGVGYPSKAWYNNALRETVNMIVENNDNDADILGEMSSFFDEDELISAVRDMYGYDGYIAKEKYDGYSDEADDAASVYVAFESNQFKNRDNVEPTTNPYIRFSRDIDSEGNKLSEDQIEYFGDSVVCDENGSLIPMYHGTPNGGFTVFNKGLNYFSPSREYSQRYADGMTRGTGATPEVKEVYLNIKHPFDVRDKATWKVFYNEYVKGGYANSIHPDTSEREVKKMTSTGLPDWNEADNIYDFLDENDLLDKYDGLILDEGGDPSDDGGVQHRPISYVTFNRNQIKNINNQHPTGLDDIRMSREIDDFWFNNDNFDQTDDERDLSNTYSKNVNILQDGFTALANQQVDQKLVRKLATDLRAHFGSTYDLETLNDNLSKVIAYAQENQGIDYEDFSAIVSEVMAPVIEESTSKEGTAERDAFVKAMSRYTMKLSDKQKAELKGTPFGSYREFKRAMTGLNFSDNGTDLSSDWTEIVDASNGLLEYDTNEADMPKALADVMDSLRPSVKSMYGASADQVARDAGMYFVTRYFDEVGKANGIKAASKAADALRATRKEYQAKIRAQYDQRYKKELAAIREKSKSDLQSAILRERAGAAAKADAQRMKAADDRQKADERLAALRAQNKHRNQEATERRRVGEQMDRLQKTISGLDSMLAKPTDKKHVPEVLRKDVLAFRDMFDISRPNIRKTSDGMYTLRVLDHVADDGSLVFDTKKFNSRPEAVLYFNNALAEGKGSKANKEAASRMQSISEMFQKANGTKAADASTNAVVDLLDGDLSADLEEILKNHEGKVALRDLNSDELKTLNKVFANVMHAIKNQDKMLTDAKHNISDTANGIIDHIDKTKILLYNAGKEGKDVNPVESKLMDVQNGATKFLALDMQTPEVYMHSLGKGGDAVYNSLLTAQVNKFNDIRQTNEFMEKELKNFTKKEIEEIRGPKAVVNTFNLSGGRTVYMTPGQVMNLYNEHGRAETRAHEAEGGIIVGAIKTNKVRIDKRTTATHLTSSEIDAICDSLTPKQRKLADAMQVYTAGPVARMWNEGSNARYNYNMVEEGGDYWMIEVDKNTVDSKKGDKGGGADMALTKPASAHELKEGANNPIVINDIFDVFTKHVNDAANYHTFAPAMADAIRVYNYREVDDNNDYRTTKKAIEKMYGPEGNRYFKTLMNDINGLEQRNNVGDWADKLVGNYKATAVLGNLSVVVQQPTAYLRALDMMSARDLLYGLAPNKEKSKINYDTNPMFWAKNQGNIDGYSFKSSLAQTTGIQTTKEKIQDVTGFLAGKADEVTWDALGRAIQHEVEREFKKQGKPVGNNPEFIEAVNNRYNHVVSRTQVIDMTMMRSQFMRSPDKMAKLQSAFMAEPTKSYNMMMYDALDIMHDPSDAKAKKNFVRSLVAFTAASVATAAAKSAITAALRGDPDKKWLLEMWENFTGLDGSREGLLDVTDGNIFDNLDPLQLLPIVKEVEDLAESYFIDHDAFKTSVGSAYYIQVLQSVFGAVSKDMENGFSKPDYGLVKKNVKAISQLTGYPAYPIMRDFMGLYNRICNMLTGEYVYDSEADKKARYKLKTLSAIEADQDCKEYMKKWVDAGQNPDKLVEQIGNVYKKDYLELYNTDRKAADELAKKISPALEYADTLAGRTRSPEKILNDWVKNGDQYKDVKQEVWDTIDHTNDLNAAKKAVDSMVAYTDPADKVAAYKSAKEKITDHAKDMYQSIKKTDSAAANKYANRAAQVAAYAAEKGGVYKDLTLAEKQEKYYQAIIGVK